MEAGRKPTWLIKEGGDDGDRRLLSAIEAGDGQMDVRKTMPD